MTMAAQTLEQGGNLLSRRTADAALGQRGRVFVVGNGDLMERTLASETAATGWDSYTAENVAAALDRLAASGFDVVVSDTSIPVQESLEQLERARAYDLELTETAHAVLDGALSALWLAFQPIVSVEGQDIVAYEALMRSHDERLPHPGAILEAAERLDRIHDVGRVVWRRAAERIAMLDRGLDVFVNLHARDLSNPELYDPTAPLSRHAHRVVLEITERAALDGLSDIDARLDRLRGLGYRLAVDDLGAGFSGLSSLVRLCPHIVKIDMSLVRDVHLDEVKQRIVGTLLRLCETMSIGVVVEGVENRHEANALIGLGARMLQGYHYGRPAEDFLPVPLDAFL